uniref:Uncharacterized protein n=1 Tax=Arundo donax TaxID=35708 RepID=A0A0A8YQB4_ARUDO
MAMQAFIPCESAGYVNILSRFINLLLAQYVSFIVWFLF